MPRQLKKTMRLEIEYDFHPTEGHSRVHWMYYEASGVDHEACKEDARKHFERQMRELGWTRWTTLNEIRPLSRANDPSKKKSVTASELPVSRSSNSGNTKPRKGGTTGSRRKSRTKK